MRPWQHAKSSSAPDRTWTDDLPIHEFLDSTKASCADRRHRLVLHHVDLGASIAARVFPERDDVPTVVRKHVIEDLRAPCTLEQWMTCCNRDRLATPLARRLEVGMDGIVDLICQRMPTGCRDAVEDVVDLLFLPTRFCPSHPEKSLAVLMNAAGPAIARRVFGPPAERHVSGQTVIVDFSWIAEAVIFAMYGRIMDLGEVARCWEKEPGETAFV
jgi:hypothetical protein